jgi:AraC-like DNA-binding protein
MWEDICRVALSGIGDTPVLCGAVATTAERRYRVSVASTDTSPGARSHGGRAGLRPDLKLLAAESGYSRTHFYRMFKAAMGQTPHRYLRELRLKRAQSLLAGRSFSLMDIALACGFSSHAHFSTAFHSRYGLSPSAYRGNLA